MKLMQIFYRESKKIKHLEFIIDQLEAEKESLKESIRLFTSLEEFRFESKLAIQKENKSLKEENERLKKECEVKKVEVTLKRA